jgi:hypothetical protein
MQLSGDPRRISRSKFRISKGGGMRRGIAKESGGDQEDVIAVGVQET